MSAPSGAQVFFGVAIVAVLAAVVGGVLLMGSPSEQRQRQLDRRRVDDLQKIAAAIDVYRTRQQRLPASLDDLGQAPGRGPSFRDPATGLAYEYRVRGDSAYELCASFGRNSAEEGARTDFWSHGVGTQCYQLEARTVRR